MNNEVIKQDKWIKRSGLRFFERLEDSMKVPTIVALNFDRVFKVMQSEWEVLSRDAFYITVAARRELTDRVSSKIYKEDDILRAEGAVFKAFEATNDFFQTRIKQAEQLLLEAGLQTEPPVNANSKKLYESISTTRTSSRWLDVLRLFDRYSWLNHQLWVTNLIGPETWTDQEALAAKLRNETRARQAVTQLTRAVNREFSQIRNIVNRVALEREEAEAARRREQSERDRQLHEQAAAAAAAVAAKAATGPTTTGAPAATPLSEGKKKAKRKSNAKAGDDAAQALLPAAAEAAESVEMKVA